MPIVAFPEILSLEKCFRLGWNAGLLFVLTWPRRLQGAGRQYNSQNGGGGGERERKLPSMEKDTVKERRDLLEWRGWKEITKAIQFLSPKPSKRAENLFQEAEVRPLQEEASNRQHPRPQESQNF